jgi:hypothetical protein
MHLTRYRAECLPVNVGNPLLFSYLAVKRALWRRWLCLPATLLMTFPHRSLLFIDIREQYMTLSGNCIFQPRVENLFGDLCDQHIERRQSEHRQYQGRGQGDEAKQKLKGT